MTEKEGKTPEFEPPQACVQRVIKAALPDNVQIGKDAKAAFARSAGIFIMYLTACANDFCRESKRQTISAQDVMQAIKELEFGELEEPLKEYLDQFRKEANAKKLSKAFSGSTPKKEALGDADMDQDADREAEGEGVGEGDEAEGDGDRSKRVGDEADTDDDGAANGNKGGLAGAELMDEEVDGGLKTGEAEGGARGVGVVTGASGDNGVGGAGHGTGRGLDSDL